MKAQYADHAEDELRLRRGPKSLVEEALSNPLSVVSGNKPGRMVAQRMVGKKLLRVVFEPRGEVFMVITAYYANPKRYGVG